MTMDADALWRKYAREYAPYAKQKRAEARARQSPNKQRESVRRRRAHAIKLTDAEMAKKAAFGVCAKARTPKKAWLLSHITGDITREREARALSQFTLDKRLADWFDANLGFRRNADVMTAAHKGMRAQSAFVMAKKLRKFYRKNKHRFNFFFVTMIHDGWRTLDRDTHIDLKDIKTRVRNIFNQRKRKEGAVNYVGVIEFDSVLNYPQKGEGICIMPHVHMIVWCSPDITRDGLETQLQATTRLVSGWGAPTVDVGSRLTDESIVHTAYYMFEQPYRAKMLRINPETAEHKLRSVQKCVPPHLTLRLSEILARCSIKELILASGHGMNLKGGVLKALKKFQREAGFKMKSLDITAAEAFRQLRATSTRGLERKAISIRR